MRINSSTGLDLCFKLINGSLIWYASFTNENLGNFCQITAAMRLIWIWKLSVFFLLTLYNSLQIKISKDQFSQRTEDNK